MKFTWAVVEERLYVTQLECEGTTGFGMLIVDTDMRRPCLKYYLLTQHSCIYFIAFMINGESRGLFFDFCHEI